MPPVSARVATTASALARITRTRPSSLSCLVISVLAITGCAPISTNAEAVAGIDVGSSGLLEVVVVDLDSRTGLPGATVSMHPLLDPSDAARTDAAGRVTFARDSTDAFGLDVSADGHVPARWTGVVGGRVVVPLRAIPEREPFEITVTGLMPDDSVVVSTTTRPTLFQPSSVRLAGATGSALATCTPAAPGECSATLIVDAAPSGRLVLVAVTDAAGAARRLVRFDGVVSGAELSLEAGSDFALETVAVTIPSLPAGLTAVVGVPGVSFGSAVGVLGFASEGAGARLPLPVVTELLATRWALLFAQGDGDGSGAPDPSRRSVLVDRRAEAELGPWTEWLAPPDLISDGATGLVLMASPGATAHVIDWVAADGSVLRTDLSFDASLSLELPASASAARVRALDTQASPSSLVLDAAERATTRFAEADVSLPVR